MEKLTLTYIGRFTTAKDGTPLVSKKTGKPYTSLRIKCNEHGDKYLSGFDGAETASWKEGDTVEVEVEQKGEYLNFSVPRSHGNGGGINEDQYKVLMREINAINTNVLRVINFVDPAAQLTSAWTPVPDFTPATMNEPPPFKDSDFPDF